MPDYDAIVIGAGNGGLTSALTIARAGRKVLLLERHNVPGGCATSFVRGRFEFEVALHQLSGMGSAAKPGPLRAMLGELGVLDRLELLEHPNLYRFIIPGSFDIVLKADREATVGELQRRFPKEREGIKAFFDLVYEFSTQMIGGIYLNDPEFSKAKYPVFFRYVFRNVENVLDEFFQDPLLRAVVSTYWGYTGVPPAKMPFGDLAIMLFAYIEFRPYHFTRGSQSLSNALLDAYLRAGGDVRFNCEVTKIGVQDGNVTGVVTETGKTITASHIVSNASTVRTYIDLIGREHLPESALQPFKAMTIGPSAFTVYLGLDCEPEAIGIRETANFITTDILDRLGANLRTLDPPKWCMLSCYNECGTAFSPTGACQVAIVALQYMEPWNAVPAQQYYEEKYRFANNIIDLANRAFPGLRDHIEEADASTPLTHMRYLGHPGGSIYGQDQFAKDSRFFTPKGSPVEGLHFAGAWVTMGGFEPTLESGWSAGRKVLSALKKQ